MFDKQSDFTQALAQHLAGGEFVAQSIELKLCPWLLDNNVRFRNAGITPCTASTTHEQSQK